MTTPTIEAIKQEIAGIRTFAEEKLAANVKPLQEENERLAAQLLNLQHELRDSRRQTLTAAPDLPARVPNGRYAGWTRDDLAIAGSLLQAQQPTPKSRGMLDQWRANLAAAMDSTTATEGDELVPTGEASELWRDVHLATKIGSLIPRIQMPTNPFDVPVDLGDVNWYPGTENVATKSTALTTGKKTLNAYELVAEVPWSYDLEEDAVISMMDQVKATLVRNAAEIIDDVILNADTTTLNGINSDGATIAATDAGKGHWLLGFDGLIHLPLLVATGVANDHSAAISDDLWNEQRRMMGKYGVDPSKCVHVVDIATYLVAQTLTGFRTLDKLGPNATLLTGQLGAVEGVPVIVSEQMLKADTDGKVTDAGNATDTGRILTFAPSQWMQGYRREVTVETDRDKQKRQTILIVSFRLALMARDTASTETHTVLSYDITGI